MISHNRHLLIVLLPGMDGTGSLFEPFLAHLPKSSTACVIPYPPDEPLSYPELEAYVRNRLPKEQFFTVIAESFSGPIALHLAAAPPEKMRAVVLICSFGYRPLGLLGSFLALLPLTLLLRKRPPGFLVRWLMLGWDTPDHLVRSAIDAIRSVKCEVLAHRLRQALVTEYCRNSPASFNGRVVALFSRKDKLLGSRARQSVFESCPQAEVREITTPHFALQADPAQVLRVLNEAGITR